MSDLLALHEVSVLRDGEQVLQRASLSLSAGERLAVIGHNGAGKTTLLRTLVGLESPQHGEVHLFGLHCDREQDFRPQRARIGYLFQDSDDQLFCPTVIEDVSFGPLNIGNTPEVAEQQARAALAELGIGHLAERVTHRLSGGEKRLVCLAGLLAMKPAVLLLDEPTNGVDRQNGEKLRNALLAFEGAMIIVSHDAAFVADIANRAMLLDHGRLEPAEIHSHSHTHVHAHVHVRDP